MEPQESVFVVAQSSPLRESQQQAFPMSPSRSAPDMNRCVADLVGRFNTLEVKDVDEEKTARQMKRLEAALRRAEIAREEAESEVKHLRKEVRELNEVGEDWVAEKKNFKGRVEEYEKKYEKAKAHFRAQRSKHDEATRKAAKEFMEREKQHWRAQSAVEEEIEWERKLRVDAYDLIAFMEVERQMMMRTAREERKRMASPARADSAVGERIGEDGKIGREERVRTKPDLKVRAEYPARVVDEVMCDSPREIEDRTSTTGQTQQHDHDATHQATSEHPAIPLIHEDAANSAIHDEVTPEPESEAPISQPKKHTLTVPIKFGDEEEEEEGPSDDKDNEDDLHNSDKENSAPPPSSFATPLRRPASALATCSRQTPSTISTSTVPATTTNSQRTPSLHHCSHSEHNADQQLAGGPATREWRREEAARTEEWNIPGVLASADLDRAAALAAIRYRRGRAKSFMNGNTTTPNTTTSEKTVGGAAPQQQQQQQQQHTPARKTTGVTSAQTGRPKTPATERPASTKPYGRRDLSAPVNMVGLGSLSVGRVRGGGRT